RRQQPAVPTADVDDRAEAGEVVGGDDGRERERRNARHRVVEDRGESGFVGEVLDNLLAPQLGDRGLAGADRLRQVAPMFAVLRRTHEPGHARKRNLGVRPQRVGERRQFVAAIAAPTEDAPPAQRSEETAECVGVGVHASRQLVGRQRSLGQGVGDAQIRRGGDGLRNPRAEDHFQHHGLRRRSPLLKATEVVSSAFNSAGHFGGWNFCVSHSQQSPRLWVRMLGPMPIVSKTIEVAASPETIMAIVADFEAYPEWNDEIKGCWVLARYDDGRPSQLRLDVSVQGMDGSYICAVYYPSPAEIYTVLQQGDLFSKQRQNFSVVGMGPTSLLTVDLDVETKLAVPSVMLKKVVNDALDYLADNLKKRAEQLAGT